MQSQISTHLAAIGYQILQVASTEKRSAGKDIIARTPRGKVLWISVKGWPERSSNTQARHWFSQALFDMILYREEEVDAELAIGLPAGFPTYSNLWERIHWFRKVLPLICFWAHEDGSVSDSPR